MNTNMFKAIASNMLTKHYGISIDDTMLGTEDYVSSCIDQNRQVFEEINHIAYKHDLERITKKSGPFGLSVFNHVDMEDQRHAMCEVATATFSHGDEIVTCPHCGSRTEFEELAVHSVSAAADLPVSSQHHKCLNAECGFEFISEEETEDEFDEDFEEMEDA
jgi:hypothetical protein